MTGLAVEGPGADLLRRSTPHATDGPPPAIA